MKQREERKTETGEAAGPETSRVLADWLKVLAEPNRLRIVDLLMQGEQCNCEMGGVLNMAPNLMSHHLKVLADAGLVRMRRDERDARWIHYSMDESALERLSVTFAAFFDPARIQERQPTCPPQVSFVPVSKIENRGVAGR